MLHAPILALSTVPSRWESTHKVSPHLLLQREIPSMWPSLPVCKPMPWGHLSRETDVNQGPKGRKDAACLRILVCRPETQAATGRTRAEGAPHPALTLRSPSKGECQAGQSAAGQGEGATAVLSRSHQPELGPAAAWKELKRTKPREGSLALWIDGTDIVANAPKQPLPGCLCTSFGTCTRLMIQLWALKHPNDLVWPGRYAVPHACPSTCITRLDKS